MTPAAVSRYVFAIVALGLAIRVAYAMITPSFQAPDEYSHYSYVRFIHDFRQLPVQPNPASRPEELQFHQPPLYYALVAPLFSATRLVEARPLLPLRFLNILISMMTVVVAFRFASAVLPHNPFATVVVCACFALLPTYSYISATVSNGALATLFASLGFYLCAKALVGDSNSANMRWFWIGAIGGLAMLSKLTTIGFVASASLLPFGISRDRREMLQRISWFTFGVFSTSGWWFLRNLFTYGQWLKIVENGDAFLPPPVSWVHETQSAIIVFKTFWAVFGRINEFHFADLYRFYWWFVGLVVIGLIRYFFKAAPDLPKRLAGFLVLAIGISLFCTLYYAHNYNSDQGRYMFPALIPISVFIAIGLSALIPKRYQRWALAAVVLSFAAVNIVVLARLAAAYSPRS